MNKTLKMMKKRFFALLLLLVTLTNGISRADEGMWIPILIEKYNIELMQSKGFRLTAEDIYSINQPSMKDAIVIFGGGCTGEIVSPEGLLFTNHHCGYRQILSHSTVENDYLTNGFWAMSRKEELPNAGLTATFMKWMEDVTDKVVSGVTEDMTEGQRQQVISQNSTRIREEAVEGTHYTAVIRPFYNGNQYFLIVNETFRDVRLVGAPPSSVGKFGGETDNWVWPRHTGDFAVFRVYAGKDNKPADYSEDNVPYKPAHYFPISMNGVAEGDFTMVFGYPGGTNQYVPSYHIEMVKDIINPPMIELRGRKIEIYEDEMAKDPLIRIQYSSKKSGVANAWKRWMGEVQGLNRMETVAAKKEYEERLQAWALSSPQLREKYAEVLPRYRELYDELGEKSLINSFTNEVFFSNGIEMVSFARSFQVLVSLAESGMNTNRLSGAIANLQRSVKSFFDRYSEEIDKRVFASLMTLYDEVIPEQHQAPYFRELSQRFNGDFNSATAIVFSESIFADKEKLESLLASFNSESVSRISDDLFFRLAVDVNDHLANNYRDDISRINREIRLLNRTYMAQQMEFEPNRVFYPDANSSLRVSYGEVMGYDARDAVYYKHYTTLSGIMEKDDPNIYDYDVPQRLRDLFALKDFGRYEVNGDVPVCFIATNHTTGGNSGSPVINADGHLIGINFDRAWEGVASDMAFNPSQSRNISVDVRYILFLIDKFAGAGYLLDEMRIVDK